MWHLVCGGPIAHSHPDLWIVTTDTDTTITERLYSYFRTKITERQQG